MKDEYLQSFFVYLKAFINKDKKTLNLCSLRKKYFTDYKKSTTTR